MLPVIRGDVSEEEVVQLVGSLGIDVLLVDQALLPALFRKSLGLAGFPKRTIASLGQRLDKVIGSWPKDALEHAKGAITDCLDGDITERDLANLLLLTGMPKPEAETTAATHKLQQALVVVLPGPRSRALVTRVVGKVKAALEAAADVADPESVAKVKELLAECNDDETRSSAAFDLLLLVGEPFESVAGQIVAPLVSNALLHAGFHIASPVAAQAAKGVAALLKDPAAAKGTIDTLMAQCRGILQGGMDLAEAAELLPQLLETVGIDASTAELAALEPALERVWAVVGLDSGAPVLKRVGTALRELIREPAHAEAQIAEIRSLINDVAVAVTSYDPGSAVRGVLGLLSSFGIAPPDAMRSVLPAMLTRVLKALAITDSFVVGSCVRTVAQLTVSNAMAEHDGEEEDGLPNSRQRTMGGFVDAPVHAAAGGAMQPLVDALSEAVLSLGASAATAPFSLDQALRLLEMLGCSAQDALLSVLSGAHLRKALALVGVPVTHGFQKEARDAVRALASSAEAQRLASAGSLKSALGAAAGAALHGGNPTGALAEALGALGVSGKSMATVMAPLLAQALLAQAGIPEEHDIRQWVARASRVVVMHAETFEEACGMVGVGVPSAAGETAGGACSGGSGLEEAATSAALRVVVKLGIPQAGFWAAVKRTTRRGCILGGRGDAAAASAAATATTTAATAATAAAAARATSPPAPLPPVPRVNALNPGSTHSLTHTSRKVLI
jgi:hypothetical protein